MNKTLIRSASEHNPKSSMKLRFSVNQAEAFRRGIDCPSSTVVIDVKPSELDQETRNLIADRLEGIDVGELVRTKEGCIKKNYFSETGKLVKITASVPTFDGLMEAISQNAKSLRETKTPQQQTQTFSQRKADIENARDTFSATHLKK